MGQGEGFDAGTTATRGVTRRRVLGMAAAGGLLVACHPFPGRPGKPSPPLPSDPFTLGVASGDPLPTRVVLWTRLAPEPTAGGGMPDVPYWVRWEVADDDRMRRVVRRGWTLARPEHGHSVHVDVHGLRPDRWYHYRFRVGNHETPVARTRTAPVPGRMPDRIRMGLASCQRYDSAFYTAYADMVASDLDLVVHVGDYLYERPSGNQVRPDTLPESITLDGYRNRYGLYKGDADLQAAHAAAPWLFTWDDHEVENNYAGDVPELSSDTPDRDDFLVRRAAAYKAYWEHMPFRRPAPTGPDFPIFRGSRWGRLAEFFVLDTRQYRADQACAIDGQDIGPRCEQTFAPDQVLLGAEQDAWLAHGLRRSRAQWAVLAQQVVFSQLAFVPGNPGFYNLDQWDGYVTARDRVIETLVADRPHDTVVLTGDIHASGVSDLKADYDDPGSAFLGAEFVAPGIGSRGSDVLNAALPLVLANNPHVRYGEATKRGWVRHDITPGAWTAEVRHVTDADVPGSPVTTAAAFTLPAGGSLVPA